MQKNAFSKSAMEFAAQINCGWNLGNSLDVAKGWGGETGWGNPVITKELIQAVADKGFNTIRIPVTWDTAFGPAPDCQLDQDWVSRVREVCKGVSKVKHASLLSAIPEGTSHWSAEANIYVNFASGEAKVTCAANEGIFFEMLTEIAGDKIDGEYSLMKYVRSASEAQKGYAKVRDALGCAQVNGYGIVSPSADDLSYENPQLVRQGSSVGIKLKASAPTYHIIRVDVAGEVSPIMGESSQSGSIVNGMMKEFETNPENAWNTDVFGKSLRTMVQEGLVSKVSAIGDDTRAKLRKAITRMTNEGKGGVICVIL